MKNFFQHFHFFAAFLLLAGTSAVAQNVATEQPAQAAQTPHSEAVFPQSEPEPASSTSKKAVPQIVTPGNATAKQAKRIAKLNEALAKAADQPTYNTPLPKLQKAPVQRTLKKLSKQLDKMGVEETQEIKALKASAAAADVSRTVTLGIVLTAIGLILTLLFAGTLNTVGIILMVVGIVLLVLGLID